MGYVHTVKVQSLTCYILVILGQSFSIATWGNRTHTEITASDYMPNFQNSKVAMTLFVYVLQAPIILFFVCFTKPFILNTGHNHYLLSIKTTTLFFYVKRMLCTQLYDAYVIGGGS